MRKEKRRKENYHHVYVSLQLAACDSINWANRTERERERNGIRNEIRNRLKLAWKTSKNYPLIYVSGRYTRFSLWSRLLIKCLSLLSTGCLLDLIAKGCTEHNRWQWKLSMSDVVAMASFFCDLAPQLGCWLAARQMHIVMLRAVMRAPLTFFDTTPIGRIISRFAKDVDVLDTSLPPQISDTIYCLFEVILFSAICAGNCAFAFFISPRIFSRILILSRSRRPLYLFIFHPRGRPLRIQARSLPRLCFFATWYIVCVCFTIVV